MAPRQPAGVLPALTVADGRLLRHAEPHQIFAGSLHYFRVPPELWRDRIGRLVDLGLNTLDTYVPWNFHQPDEHRAPDFRGWRDVQRFISTAADAGLDVILRPGPYICAEWANGGLPTWLTAKSLAPRSSDPAFVDAVEQWFGHLMDVVGPLQAAHGGPIVAVQAENEFGSFGDDAAYLQAIVHMLRRHGIAELIYTADGPTDLMLDGGAVPGVLSALTFGSKVERARELQHSRRPDEPFFCAEFWNGWFDHWGHPHHVRDAANAAGTVKEIVDGGGSVSIYMAHGGTNFGLWAGANHVDGELRPTTTSYDSDAPIAEDGTLTDKFFQTRAVLGATAPVRSAQPSFLAPFEIALESGREILPALAAITTGTVDVGPRCTFESLGLDAGLLRLESRVTLPLGSVTLNFEGVGDLALVYVDGTHLGTVRQTGTVTFTNARRDVTITVLVECLGRVNYGSRLGEHKGLTAPVLVERRMIQRWKAQPLPLDRFGASDLVLLRELGPGRADGAGVASGTFELDEPRDTHLALPGFGRGFAWVNGFLLGRYWSIGPQQTMYVPAPLLRAGENTIIALDMERRGERAAFVDRPVLGPTEEYVEEF